MLYEAEVRGSFSKDVFWFPGQGLGVYSPKIFSASRCRAHRRGFILTEQVVHFPLSAFRRPGGFSKWCPPLVLSCRLYMVEWGGGGEGMGVHGWLFGQHLIIVIRIPTGCLIQASCLVVVAETICAAYSCNIAEMSRGPMEGGRHSRRIFRKIDRLSVCLSVSLSLSHSLSLARSRAGRPDITVPVDWA